MKLQSAALIFLAALAFGGSAFAQSNLPPEARSRILIVEIDRALLAKDEQLALAKFNEMNAGNLPRPPSLHITEAKLAGRAKDYARSKSALERYFKVAGSTDKDYDEASQIYASLNAIETDAKAKTDAADRAADERLWSAAQQQNTCVGYLGYLKAEGRVRQFAPQSLSAMEQAKCPAVNPYEVPFDVRGAVAGALYTKTRARGYELAPVARATGVAGEWRTSSDPPCSAPPGSKLFIYVPGELYLSGRPNFITSVEGRKIEFVDASIVGLTNTRSMEVSGNRLVIVSGDSKQTYTRCPPR